MSKQGYKDITKIERLLVHFQKKQPSKHFLFCKTSSRRLEDDFSVTLFVFQDVLKTSWRHLEDVFAIHLPRMSSRRLQDVFQDVFKTSFKMSSRRVCKTSCNYVFKTSWKTKKCYTEDVLKTPSRRLQYVFTKTNVCWEHWHILQF